MRLLSIIASVLLLASCVRESPPGQALGEVDGVRVLRMTAERLPDLPRPRGGHHTMMLGEELTVFGGITDGFVLEPSIAYLRDGTWHEVPLKYPHLYGFTTLLPDGSVMLGGGSSENFGIGQSFGVEIYDPSTHTSKAVGIMDRKRAGCSAAALPDGRVVIAGNWYAPDAIGLYEPGKGFSFLKEQAVERAYPHILPISSDNALIFSSIGTFGERLEDRVDQLYGEPFTEPLLKEWQVQPYPVNPTQADDIRIGEGAYLIPANRNGEQSAIIRLSGGHFSLLETEHPLPAMLPDGEPLTWSNFLQVDRASRTAWMYALDGRGRLAILRICYDPIFEGGKATLEVFLADKPGGGAFYNGAIRVLEGGRIVMAGGIANSSRKDNNFETTREVWLFHTTAPEKASFPWWWILLAAVLAAGITGGGWTLMGRKKRLEEEEAQSAAQERNDLQTRITELIEEKQLFLVKDLKISDIARELGTNATYISACINGQMGVSFPEFIARYRVEYARKLMQEHPEMSSVEVWEASGFNNEKTFFRRFRSLTGMTPAEWKKQQLPK